MADSSLYLVVHQDGQYMLAPEAGGDYLPMGSNDLVDKVGQRCRVHHGVALFARDRMLYRLMGLQRFYRKDHGGEK